MKALCIIAALGLGFAGSARAQETGPYVFGTFGLTHIDSGTTAQDTANELVAIGFASANASIKENSNGFKLGGGYRINQNFAIEGYYADLGKYDVSVGTTGPAVAFSGDVKVTAWGADAVGMLALGRHTGFAKVGLYSWDSKATINGGGVSGSGSDSGTDLKLGVGIDWAVAEKLALRTEFEYFNNDNAITMLSAGLLYRF